MPPDPLLERLALDVLEDDVGAPVLLARVDHADDVRVAELGDGARLAAEPLELVGVRRDLAVHQLHGDLALERRVERAIDRRHPPGPDLGLEAVPAVQAHADERAHGVARIVADSGTGVMRMPTAWRGGLVWVSPRGCRSPWNVYPLERRHRGWRTSVAKGAECRMLVAWGRDRRAGGAATGRWTVRGGTRHAAGRLIARRTNSVWSERPKRPRVSASTLSDRPTPSGPVRVTASRQIHSPSGSRVRWTVSSRVDEDVARGSRARR